MIDLPATDLSANLPRDQGLETGADFRQSAKAHLVVTDTAAPATFVSNPFGVSDAIEIVKPDGIFVGASSPELLGGVGQFGTYGLSTGKWNSYSSKTLPIGTGFSVVGTVGPGELSQQEGGINFSKRIPTPAGDALLFINVRQDELTVPGVAEALTGQSDDKVTVSLNLGVMYSVSDGAIKGLGGAAGGPVGAVVAGAASGIGPDAWIGVGWRASATVENGEITSVNISGHEIAAADLPDFLSTQREAIEDKRSIGLNYGESDTARLNDTLLAAWGQSPWDIGYSAGEYTADGALNVLNHGNPITAITEPIYELADQYGTLPANGRISDNSEAGTLIDVTLSVMVQEHGADSPQVADAVDRLTNDYGLDFGSHMLPLLGDDREPPTELPVDYEFVRDVFEGGYRDSDDL